MRYDQALFTLLRYTETGVLDSSFGINGIQNTYFFGGDLGTSVNLQKDNKIVLAGYSQLTGSENKNYVDIARYENVIPRKQVIITKIRHWIQHHNGIEWNNINDISSYVVQRSYDGIHFNSISRINANNNSDYTYNDASSLSGTNYYRLQTISVDGAINYSNIISITNYDIKISPNPATNILHIEGLSSSSNIKITLVDFAGNVVISHQLKANSTCSYNLNIASLKQGNYLLKIEMNGEVVTKKFVKE